MQNNKKAFFTILIAFLFFSIMDLSTRYALSREVLSVVTFYTYNKIFSIIIFTIIAFSITRFEFLKIGKYKLGIAIRSILILINTLCLSFALKYLPLDIFYSIVFVMPLITLVLATIFLGEKLTALKVLAIIIGFAGVLFIANPNFASLTTNKSLYYVGVVLTLLTALSGSLLGIIVKKYFNDANPYMVNFYPLLFLVSVSLIYSTKDISIQNLIIPNSLGLFLILVNAFFGVMGALLYIKAFQIGEAGSIAPAQYSQMLWGVLFGYFILQETVQMNTIIGLCIILGANLLASYNSNLNSKAL